MVHLVKVGYIARVKPFGEASTRQFPETQTDSPTEEGQDAGPQRPIYPYLYQR